MGGSGLGDISAPTADWRSPGWHRFIRSAGRIGRTDIFAQRGSSRKEKKGERRGTEAEAEKEGMKSERRAEEHSRKIKAEKDPKKKRWSSCRLRQIVF